MSKGSRFGMIFHQGLSFSRFLMKIPKAEAIFWPGCALMNLDGRLLEKTLEILRRAEPDISLACGCCGQPTVFLFPEKAEKRQGKLVSQLKSQGVKRIYTACPNCTLQLRKLETFEIISLWPVLATHIHEEDTICPVGQFIWHDPCPTRKEAEQLAAVRNLLQISGCDYSEPEHTGAQSRCFGNYHMLAATDPEKNARIRKNRLHEFPAGRIIASSCEGCLGAFRSEDRETRHLLEILFGKSEKRSWGNRVKTTRK